ncbi:hypothetical protein EGW08_015881, partial [Elysia chlorotica]
MGPSWTTIILGAFAGYMAYSVYTMYTIFMPTPCVGKGSQCIQPFINKKPELGLQIATSLQRNPRGSMKVIWKYSNFTVDESVEKNFNISVPMKTRNNGTLYLHAFLYPRGKSVDYFIGHSVSEITAFAFHQASYINLLGTRDIEDKNSSKEESKSPSQKKTYAHWRPKVTVSVLGDNLALDRQQIPGEIYEFLRSSPDGNYYYPIVLIDELSFRLKDLLPLNESSSEMPLTISYAPISIGKLRMVLNIKKSFQIIKNLGFTEKETDEVKGIFSDTNFYLLILTFTVAAFHLLFDFLAFKNDISYWKKRKNMVGLSSRVVVWRCVSTGIIFLYLLDENTSMLVLIPAGIGTIIEIWKVLKALKVKLIWSGFIPKFETGVSTDQEKETEQFDSQAMKYLSYVLYPLCIAGAIYSLVYVEHKSWYSWCVNSLVNGVYAFGFIFMLPQLFVNYKMKSVAHLPWRAFMYKAFNTFIDDVFAFIITMPTAHRLACFRDDIVFLIYLYQRWLYPVDKSRQNEFGVSYEDQDSKSNAV